MRDTLRMLEILNENQRVREQVNFRNLKLHAVEIQGGWSSEGL